MTLHIFVILLYIYIGSPLTPISTVIPSSTNILLLTILMTSICILPTPTGISPYTVNNTVYIIVIISNVDIIIIKIVLIVP